MKITVVLGFMLAALTPPASARIGIASWYRCRGGVAMLSVPLGSLVRITNLRNGRSVTARVNDHGPFVRGRIIDVCQSQARALAIDGLGRVRVDVIDRRR